MEKRAITNPVIAVILRKTECVLYNWCEKIQYIVPADITNVIASFIRGVTLSLFRL